MKIKDENNVLTENKRESAVSIYARKDMDFIDVEGYETLCEIKSSGYSEITLDKILNNNTIFETENGKKYSLNISDEIRAYLANEKTIDDYFENNNEIEFENQKLILTNFTIDYDKLTKEVSYYSIYGYLLEK